jgi:serine/threonine-protein kinase
VEVDKTLPHPGRVVAGKYRVERVLGVGGTGSIVAARSLEGGELVALKLLHPRLAKDGESVERFLREARALAGICAEQVARVIDVGRQEDGTPFIAMEYLEGIDLAERLRSAGPLSFGVAIDCVLQACVAIAEAHALGIVHRDLKPSNLFLTMDARGRALVKVLDFGVSKFTGGAELSVTHAGEVLGSPAYMSPEQVRGAKDVDGRTDVWALGVVLHELLTGETPFSSDDMLGMLSRIVADAPRPLRATRPDLPVALQRAIDWCLAKDVSRRCPSVVELARALGPFADGPFAEKGSREWLERLLCSAPQPAPSGAGAVALSSAPPAALDLDSQLRRTPASPGGAEIAVLIALGALAGVAAMLVLLLILEPRERSPRTNAASPPTEGSAGVLPARLQEALPLTLPSSTMALPPMAPWSDASAPGG